MSDKESKQATIGEMEASVKASLAIARAIVLKDCELSKMVADLDTSWEALRDNFLEFTVAVASLRKRPPEEIALKLAIWKQRIDDGRFYSFTKSRLMPGMEI